MSSLVCILLVLTVAMGTVFAQEQPTPSPTVSPAPVASPTPAATVSPSPSPTPEEVSAEPVAATEAAPEATPPSVENIAPATSENTAASEAATTGEPVPPPPLSEDIIPGDAPALLPGDGGAPLDTQNLAPALPDNSIPDAAFTDPNAIIPDEVPLPPALPVARESLESKTRELNVRYQEVRVQADKDPQVLAMYEKSTKAKTDEDKRAALREYYRLLFKKMVAIDSNLASKCQLMERAYLRRLAQVRLEPTIPLNPPPTPAPLGGN